MMVERAYEFLLRAYPRRFRARYGSAMRSVFRDRYRRALDERRGGRFLLRSAGDVLFNGALERVTAARAWVVAPQESSGMLGPSIADDIRYAMRLFVRAPAFTGLAVLALALGIGANSAIFTVVNSVLLRPLRYADPERLVMVWGVNEGQGTQEPAAMIEGDVFDIRQASATLAQIEAFQANLVPITLRVGGDAMSAQAVAVTPGVFNLLGREALLGRTLRDGDRFTLVLSYGYWQRQFGGDPQAVGREIRIGTTPATIVGVMPPDFEFPYRSMLLAAVSFSRPGAVDAWVPMRLEPRKANDTLRIFGGIGRLRPDTTVEQARSDVSAIARRLAHDHPDTNAGWSATALRAHDETVGPVRYVLLLLLGGVGLVLIMACVNVANLLLARSVRRQREMAIRAAMGAGRTRLVRQMLTESVLLTMIGGAVAWLVVEWATRAFVALAPGEVPRLAEISPDWRVMVYTIALALVTGVAAGLIPALTGSRIDLQRRLADASRGSSTPGNRTLRSSLVVAEVALALVLALGAGLFVRSFVAVLGVYPGFRTENLLTMQAGVPRTYDTPEKRRGFFRRLFERLEAVPGVETVGGTTRLPLGGANSSTRVVVEGRERSRGGLEIGLRRALHDYFAAMEIPIVRGRTFDSRDGADAPPVVLINQTMALRVFPGEDPIGRRVTLGENAGIGTATIVGVVGDVRHEGLEARPAPEIYIHYLQNPPVAPLLVLRTKQDPGVVAAAVRLATREVDPALTLFDFKTMTELRAESVTQRKFLTLLATIFGLVALTLAAVGVYGVMALVVSERTQEMGIRVALGAEPRKVLALVVRQGVSLAATGIAVGLVVSLAITPMLSSQLYGIRAADPMTLAAVPALLVLVAVAACLGPARRAMRVDPVTALRSE